jgi:hypothetical protein
VDARSAAVGVTRELPSLVLWVMMSEIADDAEL